MVVYVHNIEVAMRGVEGPDQLASHTQNTSTLTFHLWLFEVKMLDVAIKVVFINRLATQHNTSDVCMNRNT